MRFYSIDLSKYSEDVDMEISNQHQFEKILGSTVDKNSQVKPAIALQFYKKTETKQIFEALDVITEKWKENVKRFEQQDRRDTYLNGYKLGKDNSPVYHAPGLQLVKERTTIAYNVFNDSYAYRSMQSL